MSLLKSWNKLAIIAKLAHSTRYELSNSRALDTIAALTIAPYSPTM